MGVKEEASSEESKIWPKANKELEQEIYGLIRAANGFQCIKKGTNECKKKEKGKKIGNFFLLSNEIRESKPSANGFPCCRYKPNRNCRACSSML